MLLLQPSDTAMDIVAADRLWEMSISTLEQILGAPLDNSQLQ
jgi:hypothetical protein